MVVQVCIDTAHDTAPLNAAKHRNVASPPFYWAVLTVGISLVDAMVRNGAGENGSTEENDSYKN